MSFRFIKVSRFYPAFLKQYYGRNPAVPELSYADQYVHLMREGFGWSDYLCRHLQKDFGVESWEIVSNAHSLQKKWAQENNSQKIGTDLVFEQIKKFKPDVVFLQDTISFNRAWIRSLKEEVPSVKLILGWRCSPYTSADLERFGGIDVMLSCTPAFVKEFQRLGFASQLLNHGFETSSSPPPTEKDTDVMFAGSLVQAKGYHYGRIDFLSTLVKSGIPLQLYVDSFDWKKNLAKKAFGSLASMLEHAGPTSLLESSSLYARANQWKNVHLFDENIIALQPRCKPQIFGRQLFEKMARAKINLNFHIDSAGDYAGNARLFEATGSGSCLVTDKKKNLSDFFEPDYEVVTFESTEECLEKLRWLLANPGHCQKIADAGKKRCLKDHSFQQRAGELHSLISSRLS